MQGAAVPTSPAPLPSHSPPAAVRRTRIVCIADTHNSTVKLPKGDVLIHAGDLTNQGSHSELSRAVAWLEKAEFECKIIVAGNHDITLDGAFYAQHGAQFHSQIPQSTDDCRELLERSPTITYMCHGSATVHLKDPKGPRTRFTVFGSPYSPRNGTWAFSYQPAEDSIPPLAAPADQKTATGRSIWSHIPADTDIVVTHTPPFLHCDWSATHSRSLGCRDLWRALQRVRPRLAVCGHVHEGRGAERVRWGGAAEDGGVGACGAHTGAAVKRWEDPSSGPHSGKMSAVDLTARVGRDALDNDGSVGGNGGRRETCIVNCAITATNHPHVGGKKLNKPIVVDLDLPVSEEGRPAGRSDLAEAAGSTG